MTLEDLQLGATVRGILPDAAVSVVSVEWHDSDALTLVYRGPSGRGADENFILAIVEFREDDTHRVHYVRVPFRREPDFGVTSVNYDFAELVARAAEPT